MPLELTVTFMFVLLCPETLMKLFAECNEPGNTNWIAKVHFFVLLVQKVWTFRRHQNCTICLVPESLYPSSKLSVLCSFEGWVWSHVWVHVSSSVTFALITVAFILIQLFQNPCPWVYTLHFFLLFFVALNITCWVSVCQGQAPNSEAFTGALWSGLFSRSVKNAVLPSSSLYL